MARPRKVWAAEQRGVFERLCNLYCTKAEICKVLGMDRRTLDKCIAETYSDTPTWAEAFERFSAKARAELRRKQFEVAMSGDRSMLIWLGKNYLGQSERPDHARV